MSVSIEMKLGNSKFWQNLKKKITQAERSGNNFTGRGKAPFLATLKDQPKTRK